MSQVTQTQDPIDVYLGSMNTVMDETDAVRADMQGRLLRQIDVLDQKFAEEQKFNPEDRQAYMESYKTLNTILNDRDKNRMGKVSTHLKKKDVETNNKLISQIAAENLKNTSIGAMLMALQQGISITPGTVSVPEVLDDATEQEMQRIYREHGVQVSKNSLKDDPNDYTEEAGVVTPS